MARKTLLKGVGDFSEVAPTLYRGSQPTHDGFKELARMGIKIVVDVRGTKRDGEGKEVRKLGMQCVSIPWHCPFPRDEVFTRFLKLLRDHPGKKVFVHCRLGDDRDGMMITSYRVAIEAWSAEEAMQEMQTFGFTRAHHLICLGLARYEKHFPEQLKRIQSSKNFAPRTGQRKPSKRARLSVASKIPATQLNAKRELGDGCESKKTRWSFQPMGCEVGLLPSAAHCSGRIMVGESGFCAP